MTEHKGRERGDGGVYLRGQTWWLKYYHSGTPHYESSRSTRRADAVKLLRQRLGEVGAGRFTPEAKRLTVAGVMALVLEKYRADGRRSLPRAKLAERHVTDAMGTELARDVDYARLTRYVAAVRERWAPATIAYDLALLRHGFRLAKRSRKLTDVPDFPMPTVENARKGFFTREGFDKVRAELPTDLHRNIATCAYLMGWRKDEILKLTWDRVDLARGVIRLDVGETKSKDGRTFPAGELPELMAALGHQRLMADALEARTGQQTPLVFHRDGRPVRGFYKAWRSAVARAGFPGARFHDFRRCGARNLVANGVPEHVAMQLTGHKTREIFRRYAITNEQDLRAAVQRLPESAANATR